MDRARWVAEVEKRLRMRELDARREALQDQFIRKPAEEMTYEDDVHNAEVSIEMSRTMNELVALYQELGCTDAWPGDSTP